jgi:hypothetical protein
MQKEKFASQADPEVLAALRAIAEKEGRQFQSLIDEALRDIIEKKRNDKPRPHVIIAYQQSLKEFDELYRKLAQ